MKKQPIIFRLLSFIGSAVYSFRLWLESFNDKVDAEAGRYWKEGI